MIAYFSVKFPAREIKQKEALLANLESFVQKGYICFYYFVSDIFVLAWNFL